MLNIKCLHVNHRFRSIFVYRVSDAAPETQIWALTVASCGLIEPPTLFRLHPCEPLDYLVIITSDCCSWGIFAIQSCSYHASPDVRETSQLQQNDLYLCSKNKSLVDGVKRVSSERQSDSVLRIYSIESWATRRHERRRFNHLPGYSRVRDDRYSSLCTAANPIDVSDVPYLLPYCSWRGEAAWSVTKLSGFWRHCTTLHSSEYVSLW